MAASIVAFRARDPYARHASLHAAVRARQRQRAELELARRREAIFAEASRVADEIATDTPEKRAARVERVRRLINPHDDGPVCA